MNFLTVGGRAQGPVRQRGPEKSGAIGAGALRCALHGGSAITERERQGRRLPRTGADNVGVRDEVTELGRAVLFHPGSGGIEGQGKSV